MPLMVEHLHDRRGHRRIQIRLLPLDLEDLLANQPIHLYEYLEPWVLVQELRELLQVLEWARCL